MCSEQREAIFGCPPPLYDFQGFPKIPRFNRQIVVTEKLDGANVQVLVSDGGDELFVGSRSRWITPKDDHYGFAAWCAEHKDQLLTLGPGRHFGEWWGLGINRGYGKPRKIFSLFNVERWSDPTVRPDCCSVVPTLYKGPFLQGMVSYCLDKLRINGSEAAPGFMQPEGIVIFHTAAQQCFKVTLENDGTAKSEQL